MAHNDGCFIACFEVDAFRPLDEFQEGGRRRVHPLHLKATPPAEGSSGVLYPGEIEHMKEQDRRRNGIDVEDATWGKLCALADTYSLTDELGMGSAELIRLAAALIAAALLAPLARAADGPNLTIIEPYGMGSATDRVIGLYKPGLKEKGDQPSAYLIEHDGAASLDKLGAAAPNGHTVIVVDLLSVEIAEEAARHGTAKISALTPIAKLTGPDSLALVVPDSSPIKSWADFAAAAKVRPADDLPRPAGGARPPVPLTLMEKALGGPFCRCRGIRPRRSSSPCSRRKGPMPRS